ncbi:MAG: hypothetical protein WCC90_15085 [Methylocella sp.]
MKVMFIIACAVIAAAAAYYAQPYVHDSDVVLIIVTVFTVFAGFLIAIITILGDPSMIPEGSWRVVEIRRVNIEKRLHTHVMLFMLYLITIGLLFVGVVLHKTFSDECKIKTIEMLYLFFGVFSFLLSFGLPISLMKLQKARVDAETERRRRIAGIGRPEQSDIVEGDRAAFNGDK